MTCERVSAQQGAASPWTRRPKFSVIQRPQAVESPGQGQCSAATVDVGGLPSPPSSSRSGDPPVRGRAVRCCYPHATNSGILRSLTLPLNDSIFSVRRRYPGGTNGGIASSQSPLGSASALRRKLRSLPCSSFSAAIRFAGFASEAWAAERENDVQEWRCGAGCIPGCGGGRVLPQNDGIPHTKKPPSGVFFTTGR